MQQNGEKCNSLSAFDQREDFKKNSRWISEGQCYTHSVCFWALVFSWFGAKISFFSLLIPRRKHSHKNTSQHCKHGETGTFLQTLQLKSGGTWPLIYQQQKKIWNMAGLRQANAHLLLWEFEGKPLWSGTDSGPRMLTPCSETHTHVRAHFIDLNFTTNH